MARGNYELIDCDAHVNDPNEIWSRYVEPEYRDLVRQSYWKDENRAVLNGLLLRATPAAESAPGARGRARRREGSNDRDRCARGCPGGEP